MGFCTQVWAEEVKSEPAKAVAAPVVTKKVEVTETAKTIVVKPAVAVVEKTEVAKPEITSPAPVEELPWWKVILSHALELIFSLLGIIVIGFVNVLLKKYGFESYTEKVDDLLERGVGFAEQKSLIALKLNGKPLDSGEKLQLALGFITEKAKDYKLPQKTRDWWEDKVESWLGMENIVPKKV